MNIMKSLLINIQNVAGMEPVLVTFTVKGGYMSNEKKIRAAEVYVTPSRGG